MGGFVGAVEYRGELARFVPLLTLGQKVNVGKATGFGLGRYMIGRPNGD
jgi:CRISPR/Cas system endoribonuclease Cas6 (RAMP superfamily)